MTNQDDLKRAVAKAAIEYVPVDSIVGVGTGSTANFFIDELAKIKHKIRGAVASSEASAKRLMGHGIDVLPLNDAGGLQVYVDGADEITRHLHMIKGGGGALTREKIVAAASKKFICVCDASKLVDVLGRFPLPVEVIPMARSSVARQLVALGGQPKLRGLYHRQRQYHPRCARVEHHESGGAGIHWISFRIGIRDARPVHIEDDIAVVGGKALAQFWLSAQRDKQNCAPWDHLDRQREPA